MLLKKFSFKILVCFGLLIVMLFSFAACAPQKKGNFYTLQEAFDQGLLTVNDLKNIAYYQNGESPDESFVPTAKNPETLSSKTENAIKETRAYYYRYNLAGATEDAKPNGFQIVKYLGTYNNSVAVVIISDYENYPAVEWQEEVEGVIFKYGIRIDIFKAN